MARAWRDYRPKASIAVHEHGGQSFNLRRLPGNYFSLLSRFTGGDEGGEDAVDPAETLSLYTDLVWHCWVDSDGSRMVPATDEDRAALAESDPAWLQALGQAAMDHTMSGFAELGPEPGN